MKIVITGASGQYGRSTVRKLLETTPAEDLILMTRRPEKLSEFAALGADVRQGDFDDPASLATAFAGGDRLLLISGTRVGARVAQHKAAIDAAAAAGVRHIAYTSILGIHPDSPAVVKRDHGPTEEMMKASGMAWTALRDSQYMDAVVFQMIGNALRSGKWISSAGEGRIAYVAREDCVDCAVAVLTGTGHENRVYQITGPQLFTHRETAALANEILGTQIDFVPTDDDGLYAMFDALGIPRHPVDDQVVAGIPWNSDDMVTFEAAIREGFFDILSSDVETLTGHPPLSLRKMLESAKDKLIEAE